MPFFAVTPARSLMSRMGLVIALVFLIAWTSSIKIIFYNATEDHVALVDLFILSGGIAVTAAILAFPILLLRKVGLVVPLVLIGLAVAATVNTFIIPSGPNVLDGIMESDAGLVLKRAVTAVMVLSGLVLWISALRKRTFVFPLARALVIAAFCYAVIFSAIAVWNIPDSTSRLLTRSANVTGLELSVDRNILVISFDQMQGSVVKGVLRRNPELAAKLEGFKFFPDAASVYPNTSYSISSVLLGRMPTGPEEYFDAVIPKQNIIRAAHDKGYAAGWTFAQRECDICLPKIPPGFDRNRVAEQAVQIYSLATQQAFGIGVRTVAMLGRPFVPQTLGPTAAKASWKLDADAFLASVENAQLTSNKPVVQYRHYFATHQPILYDRSCRVRDELATVQGQDLSGAEGEVTCVLTRFSQFVDKLKELGVYDKTMLILASDHGYEANINSQDGNPLVQEMLFPGSATLGPENIKPAGAYNPSLFFKDFGAHGPMTEVDTPASLIDISATVCDAIGGCGFALEGQSLQHEIPKDRVRRYWRYFGGRETRFADNEDRLHRGMGKWWEARRFTGSLELGLVPSLAKPPSASNDPKQLVK